MQTLELLKGCAVIVRVNMPGDIDQFRLPKALDRRLQHLLDKQSIEGRLSPSDRAEAEGLVEMAEILSLLRLRSRRVAKRRPRK